MTQLALDDSDRLKASDIEFRMAVPSYTIDTLAFLEEKYPKNEFCLVMGEDNLYTLHKWKNVEELIKKYPIYYYPRPDVTKPSSPLLDHILSTADIHLADAPRMDISGTFIRNGIRHGKDMSYFLPQPVWKYIREMHFYEK
jgi:nicotinate-nucleotide adenylyltransferase